MTRNSAKPAPDQPRVFAIAEIASVGLITVRWCPWEFHQEVQQVLL